MEMSEQPSHNYNRKGKVKVKSPCCCALTVGQIRSTTALSFKLQPKTSGAETIDQRPAHTQP
jgi:hypothetical protein